MSPWEKILAVPTPQGHLVQLYGADKETDKRCLVLNVSRYLLEGLNRGSGAIVVATEPHARAFCRQLEDSGADVATAKREGQLAVFDAQETLSSFMVNGQPDWDRFQNVAGKAMSQVRATVSGSGLRAYGEMVGILWKSRQYSAAVRLEQFWNKLLTRSSFSLYCAYGIDVFGREFQVGALNALLCTHTHLIPADMNGNVESALARAIEEIVGSSIDDLRPIMKVDKPAYWGVMPAGESTALWVRTHLPQKSEQIMLRAREHFEALQNPRRLAA